MKIKFANHFCIKKFVLSIICNAPTFTPNKIPHTFSYLCSFVKYKSLSELIMKTEEEAFSTRKRQDETLYSHLSLTETCTKYVDKSGNVTFGVTYVKIS